MLDFYFAIFTLFAICCFYAIFHMLPPPVALSAFHYRVILPRCCRLRLMLMIFLFYKDASFLRAVFMRCFFEAYISDTPSFAAAAVCYFHAFFLRFALSLLDMLRHHAFYESFLSSMPMRFLSRYFLSRQIICCDESFSLLPFYEALCLMRLPR